MSHCLKYKIRQSNGGVCNKIDPVCILISIWPDISMFEWSEHISNYSDIVWISFANQPIYYDEMLWWKTKSSERMERKQKKPTEAIYKFRSFPNGSRQRIFGMSSIQGINFICVIAKLCTARWIWMNFRRRKSKDK